MHGLVFSAVPMGGYQGISKELRSFGFLAGEGGPQGNGRHQYDLQPRPFREEQKQVRKQQEVWLGCVERYCQAGCHGNWRDIHRASGAVPPPLRGCLLHSRRHLRPRSRRARAPRRESHSEARRIRRALSAPITSRRRVDELSATLQSCSAARLFKSIQRGRRAPEYSVMFRAIFGPRGAREGSPRVRLFFIIGVLRLPPITQKAFAQRLGHEPASRENSLS